MTPRTPDLLAAMSRRVTTVASWHIPAQRRHGRRLCTECGQPWPCRTRLALLGHGGEDRK